MRVTRNKQAGGWTRLGGWLRSKERSAPNLNLGEERPHLESQDLLVEQPLQVFTTDGVLLVVKVEEGSGKRRGGGLVVGVVCERLLSQLPGASGFLLREGRTVGIHVRVRQGRFDSNPLFGVEGQAPASREESDRGSTIPRKAAAYLSIRSIASSLALG
jgi:hypothetical protein